MSKFCALLIYVVFNKHFFSSIYHAPWIQISISVYESGSCEGIRLTPFPQHTVKLTNTFLSLHNSPFSHSFRLFFRISYPEFSFFLFVVASLPSSIISLPWSSPVPHEAAPYLKVISKLFPNIALGQRRMYIIFLVFLPVISASVAACDYCHTDSQARVSFLF